MTDITVIHVGEGKEKYFADAEKEYIKRMSPFCRYRTVCIKEERIDDENSDALILRALQKEGEAILKSVPRGDTVVAACIEGKKYDSVSFAKMISERSMQGGITFIIGSSHGLDESVKHRADIRLSISDMTFPHRLMRVILAEQVYRAFSINNGKNYHK